MLVHPLSVRIIYLKLVKPLVHVIYSNLTKTQFTGFQVLGPAKLCS